MFKEKVGYETLRTKTGLWFRCGHFLKPHSTHRLVTFVGYELKHGEVGAPLIYYYCVDLKRIYRLELEGASGVTQTPAPVKETENAMQAFLQFNSPQKPPESAKVAQVSEGKVSEGKVSEAKSEAKSLELKYPNQMFLNQMFLLKAALSAFERLDRRLSTNLLRRNPKLCAKN